jgi:hypothetical protein
MDSEKVRAASEAYERLCQRVHAIGTVENPTQFEVFPEFFPEAFNQIDLNTARGIFGSLRNFYADVVMASAPLILQREQELELAKQSFEGKTFSDPILKRRAESDYYLSLNLLCNVKSIVRDVEEKLREAENRLTFIQLIHDTREAQRLEQESILREEEDRINRRSRLSYDEEFLVEKEIKMFETPSERILRLQKKLSQDINNFKNK